MSETLRPLSAEDIYKALLQELDHACGYIEKRPMSLDSVTVDGTISCKDVAVFLNQRVLGVPPKEPAQKDSIRQPADERK